MVEHGWHKFQAWFDDKSWYPLGRHVGSTTYPGLQLTAWAIFEGLKRSGFEISLNDVCVLIPAGFGAIASLFTGALGYEVTKSSNAAVAATALMAILPAHLMRSVAGGYDNESVAVTLIVATCYFWVRSLRSGSSWPFAFLCGLSYAYLVAVWGGYIFVLNMIGAHAGMLTLLGRFSTRLWVSYSIWFTIGTAGALFGPARYLVGWQPLQSLEQLGPFAVFCLLQLSQFIELISRRYSLNELARFRLCVLIFGVAAVVASVICATLLPSGFFGPLSARVRGLFIRHTKTGNPLVDSVAEHQATPAAVYWQYFHFVCLLGPIGGIMCFFNRTDAKIFFLLYAFLGSYFSAKMIRLVLLLSPAACIAGGACLGGLVDMTVTAMYLDVPAPKTESPHVPSQERKPMKKGNAARHKSAAKEIDTARAPKDPFSEDMDDLMKLFDENVEARRLGGVAAILFCLVVGLTRFVPHCWHLGRSLSEPQIMLRGKDKAGVPIIIDDFREAYWWLRDHTPEDSRVMAWWDYGYQINGVANRTTIADGNTWNHEHIALLGKCFVSPEDVSHAIVRHLADYVLIWTTRYAGMYSDDLAKSPHMARIAGSVYSDVDPKSFYLDQQGNPSPMMNESVLWRMHGFRYDHRVKPLNLFEEAYTSTHKMVRIFKVRDVSHESKQWRANRGIECSHEECYPPALSLILQQKKSFKQLHGF